MNAQQIADTAATLSSMAPHPSVTREILAGREGEFSTATPLSEPPVTYLEGTEAPAYVLTNGKRGIGLGTKRNTVTPDSDFRTVVLVTGRRTLCLVGGEPEDEVIEIPHDAVVSTTCKTGLRAKRLALRTPKKQYHCWVHRKVEADRLDAAASFVEDRRSDSPETVDNDDGANRVMYRGRPVSNSANEGTESDSETDQTVMYRGRPVDDSTE